MNLWLMIKVIARSPITYLSMLGGVLTVVSTQLVPVLGVDHPIIAWLGGAIIWIGVIIEMIRRVTPVLKPARGVLPKLGEPLTSNEQWALNELAHERNIVGNFFNEDRDG